ncbi:antibiotic biosynthesis monooxygenase family protein [Enterococcus mediterraneensis]|uniref:antibiotic biosynthesis monooxygenase family protein n=1 Tax=Enterococcus mediterraneensis TaxID=2364791 RepID=UPI000F052F21|nr:antibiotic biosynthesis monooxygenase family protein [Enterococcus mediterraneensis]
MSITVNILYTGTDGNARKFAEEMMERKIVEGVRTQPGNESYAYFFPAEDPESVLLIDRWENEEAIDRHHKSEWMPQIAALREKYRLRMKVERFQDWPED